MKVDGSLKSLIQGVSQQPSRTRLPGQCSLQENMSSNPVDGLTRRPPLDWINTLFESEADVQFYDLRLGVENYIIATEPSSLRVFALDGTEKTVTEDGDAFDYLDGGKLTFTNLENVTYVANTSVKCAMETELPSFVSEGPIVYIRGGNYGAIYTITVNWKDAGVGGTARSISVSHTTSTTDITTIQTTAIATALKALLDAVTTNSFNTTFDVFQQEDVLYIQWKTATLRTDMFTAVASDTAGNNNCIACNNDVKLVSQLPRFAPHGYFVRVSGDGSAKQDDYYLEFSVTPDDQGVTPALGAGFGKAGIWIETVKSDIEYLLDRDTMPHVLTYDGDTDEFTFAVGEWGDRLVGDEDTNPTPSFIGRTVNNLGYFQGRLVMLAGPAVVMSRTNKPLDFWAESALEVADTDPIDVQSTAQGVTQMLRAIPNNRDLVVFADNAQFIVLGRNAITPLNCSLVLTTSFEANLDATPVPAGRNIFFAINYGGYTGIREFYTSDSVDINDSRPITQHVLKYIPGNVRRLASTSNFDTLLVQSSDSLTNLYVYEYIWVQDKKAQSSWSKWIMPDDVMYFFFVESVIYVVSKINSSYCLSKMDLDTRFDDNVPYQVKLDRKVSVDGVRTTIANPIPFCTDPDDMVFVQGKDCPYPGMRAMVKEYNAEDDEITFTTDMEEGTVLGGIRYRSAYRPTIPFVKDADGVKVGTGRLVISKFFINCRETGDMNARLLSKYRAPVELRFSGRVVGNPNTLIGVPAIADTTFTVPFRDNIENAEIELYTDSHLPLVLMDIEWLGQYTKRGQRITQGD